MTIDQVPTGELEDHETLLHIGVPAQGASTSWPCVPYHAHLPRMDEYCALETVTVARNFDGIAEARSEKPRRQIDVDKDIAEQPVAVHGGDGGADGDAHTESIASRAQTGLAVLGHNTRLAHRFDEAILSEILSFKTSDRTQAFVKELQDTDLMSAGELPMPDSEGHEQAARARLQSEVLGRFPYLQTLPMDTLRSCVELQRQAFAGSAPDTSADPSAEEVPPPPSTEAQSVGSAEPQVHAYFEPEGRWRRPSDFVAHLAKNFEEEWVNPKTGQVERRPLKRDQLLFVAQFAEACNAVWDDEQQVRDGTLEVKDRRSFSFLVLGQAGSGKTSVIQDIVIPAIDFFFPRQELGGAAVLIVCSKWSQCENISTPSHKAVTCHRAGLVGVQNFRKSNLHPQDKKPGLVKTWSHLRCLILEEVSMIAPPVYNMLLYRSFHGRREAWQVPEADAYQQKGAFGRMPITVHLGDFLQLKPTGASVSLITDLNAAFPHESYPAEYQDAMKLFCHPKFCFDLRASNRFLCERLRDLLNFMRAPAKRVPPAIAKSWAEMQLKPSDERLRQQNFQEGHMIAIYWETVARWMMMRAKRDAKALRTPLILVQAADASEPPMSQDMAKKLMNKANPKDTGSMHGMMAVHLGMRMRLLEALDIKQGLVKDAEGDVVHIVYHPLDQAEVSAATAAGAEQVYLRNLPLGFWLRMDKYNRSTFDDTLGTDAGHLVFIEPRTSDQFVFRKHKVKRTGFPLSHGRVLTTTACQGRTMRAGVVIDCGRHETGETRKENGDWWLDIYVMLSRATRLSDLLLLRAPGLEFLLEGPPRDLSERLKGFARKAESCRDHAMELVQDLNLEAFLR